MSDTAELVTIGITCFNAADTIERALESAVNQDWTNCEIILVDDCSTDGSLQIANIFANNHRQIRIIERERNGGPAASRNTILQNANGVFIAFFDDDDISYQHRVSEQVQQLKAFEKAHKVEFVACYSSGQRRYENGYIKPMEAIGSRGKPFLERGLVAKSILVHDQKKNYYYGSGTPACALMARKKTFEEVGYFDDSMRRVEDADFAIRLDLIGGAFIGTRKIGFEQLATHAPDKSPEKNLEAEVLLAQKNKDYLEALGLYYYGNNWPRLRYLHFKRQYTKFIQCFAGLFIRYPIRSLRHLAATGPARLLHERSMNRGKV